MAESQGSKRNCIVAIDGSEHADYALDWFCKNIHRKGDHVVLVFVPELNEVLHTSRWNTSAIYQFDREVMLGLLKEEQERIKSDLEKFAGKLREHGLGGKVKSVMATKPGEGILKAAEEENADLIVTGSRGMGQLRRTFIGSVSDYLVHHSHVPVLVCKHPGKHVPDEDKKHKEKDEKKEDEKKEDEKKEDEKKEDEKKPEEKKPEEKKDGKGEE